MMVIVIKGVQRPGQPPIPRTVLRVKPKPPPADPHLIGRGWR